MNIGVTGNFLSGKSTFAGFLAEYLHFQFFSCDAFINQLYTKKNIQKIIIDNFGKKAYLHNIIQKDYISDLVFKSQEKLNDLKNILYPELFNKIEKITRDNISTVYEIPLLYETGLDEKMDHCILVKGNKKTISERASERGYKLNEVKKRLGFQLSEQEMEKFKPIIINNNRTIIELKQEAFRIAKLLS